MSGEGMRCPHCGFRFRVLATNAAVELSHGDELPDIAPLICENCIGISLLVDGAIRKPTAEELVAIQQSPAWRDVLEPVARLIRDTKFPPADRTKTTLTDGSPVTPDHRDINPQTGMQKGYVVLSEDERDRGFVRPLRFAYTHKPCGSDTTMGGALAETYARDPKFYSGTFCCHCRQHFPLDQFVWLGTDEQVGS